MSSMDVTNMKSLASSQIKSEDGVDMLNEDNLPNFVIQAGIQKLEHSEGKFKIPLGDVKSRKKTKKTNFYEGIGSKALKRRNFYRDEVLHLECEWEDCCDTASSMEDFMRHVAIHVRESEVRQNPAPLLDVFACLWAGCGFESSTSDEMVRHIHFHSFHTKIKCHGKNMLATNGLAPCKLDPAQRNILPDLSQPFQCQWEGCDFAEENWQMSQNFYWHVKDHPEDLRGMEVKCRWRGCTKVDTAVSKLKDHMRCHSQERMVGCPTCGGMFANRIKFFDHCLRQQVDEHSFTCTNCSKKFAIERHLRDHMRSHINHYKCPHCDMTCPSPSTLKNHIRYRHTQEKPFSCEFCAYRGKTSGDIKSHLRIHYNEVEMKCPQEDCQFTCRAKMTMKQHHLSVHTDTLPMYACHLCDMRYDRGAYLTKHLTKTHSFSWPSGHSRFRYTKDATTGLFRLQTIRFESVDLQEEMRGSGVVTASTMEFNPPSVDSRASDWDSSSQGSFQSSLGQTPYQHGPHSVQSCPEFGSPFHNYLEEGSGPWSVQAYLEAGIEGHVKDEEFKPII